MAARKKASLAPIHQNAIEQKRLTTESPLVFISHDSRDADLAEAFGNLLTDASGGILKSFRSSDRKGTAGIEYGQEWYRAIMQKLDDAAEVISSSNMPTAGPQPFPSIPAKPSALDCCEQYCATWNCLSISWRICFNWFVSSESLFAGIRGVFLRPQATK